LLTAKLKILLVKNTRQQTPAFYHYCFTPAVTFTTGAAVPAKNTRQQTPDLLLLAALLLFLLLLLYYCFYDRCGGTSKNTRQQTPRVPVRAVRALSY
jgi:uncharacterized membrane protein YfcA